MGDGGVPGPGWGVEGTRPGAEKQPPYFLCITQNNKALGGSRGGPLGGPRGGLCGPLGGL